MHGHGTFVGRMSLAALVESLAFRGLLSSEEDQRLLGQVVDVRQTLEQGLSGEIIAGNAELGGQPDLINRDPYGGGWIMRVRPEDKSQFAAMLDAKAYEAALAAETH